MNQTINFKQNPKQKTDLSHFKINRGELKRTALSGLSGNWGFAIGALLLAFVMIVLLWVLIAAVTAIMPTILSLILILVAFVLMILVTPFMILSLSWLFLDFVRGEESHVTDLVHPVFESFGRNILTVFLVQLYLILWSMLFGIPGIIKRYAYSQTYYILKDNPNLSASDAITLSREMMNGHKAELFVLDLSFIGWWFLGGLTLGLANIGVLPYYFTVRALYYENLKNGYEAGYRQNMDPTHLAFIIATPIIFYVMMYFWIVRVINLTVGHMFESQMRNSNRSYQTRTYNQKEEQLFKEFEKELMRELGRR